MELLCLAFLGMITFNTTAIARNLFEIRKKLKDVGEINSKNLTNNTDN